MPLQPMPPIGFAQDELLKWGAKWRQKAAFVRRDSVNFARYVDEVVAASLAKMLGGIPIRQTHGQTLQPPEPNCVEVGNIRVIGGVRPQNFDVAYRPDGPRIVFDSKTLNDSASIRKNWQNMVNDIATEATTVHTRFPYTVVAFMVIVPEPALHSLEKQQSDIILTLERLGRRVNVLDEPHLAETIALVLWKPDTGEIEESIPGVGSPLSIARFPEALYARYVERFKGLPPHG